jgi:hypothetical protein
MTPSENLSVDPRFTPIKQRWVLAELLVVKLAAGAKVGKK